MKKLLLASTVLTALSAPVIAEEIKVGIILGFTGPIESQHLRWQPVLS